MYIKQNALVVMYHYVYESRDSFPKGVRPLFLDEFVEQLDWLQDNFEIVSPADFVQNLKDGQPISTKPSCLLTFDDGTRDHWEVVAPILERRSLTGVFFVLTWPTQRQKMPVTHALHWLLGHSEEQVWAELENFAEANLGGIDALGSRERASKLYHYEPGLRGRIKYAINFGLPADAVEEVIATLAQSHGQPLDMLAAQWFLNEHQIRQLSASGMEIGIHGSSHRSLTQLGAKGMAAEVADSFTYLHSLTGKDPTWFCCPFGGSDTDQGMEIVHQACRLVGVEAIVTTEKAFVIPETCLYKIPRYDCIYIPPRSYELIA